MFKSSHRVLSLALSGVILSGAYADSGAGPEFFEDFLIMKNHTPASLNLKDFISVADNAFASPLKETFSYRSSSSKSVSPLAVQSLDEKFFEETGGKENAQARIEGTLDLLLLVNARLAGIDMSRLMDEQKTSLLDSLKAHYNNDLKLILKEGKAAYSTFLNIDLAKIDLKDQDFDEETMMPYLPLEKDFSKEISDKAESYKKLYNSLFEESQEEDIFFDAQENWDEDEENDIFFDAQENLPRKKVSFSEEALKKDENRHLVLAAQVTKDLFGNRVVVTAPQKPRNIRELSTDAAMAGYKSFLNQRVPMRGNTEQAHAKAVSLHQEVKKEWGEEISTPAASQKEAKKSVSTSASDSWVSSAVKSVVSAFSSAWWG